MDAGVWILSRHPCRLLWLLCSWGWKWHWHNKCNNNHPDNQVNDRIGRCGAGGGTAHLTSLKRVRDWCDQHGVLFKVMLFDIFVCQALWIFSFSSWTRWWTATTGWRTWSPRLTSSVRSAGRWSINLRTRIITTGFPEIWYQLQFPGFPVPCNRGRKPRSRRSPPGFSFSF